MSWTLCSVRIHLHTFVSEMQKLPYSAKRTGSPVPTVPEKYKILWTLITFIRYAPLPLIQRPGTIQYRSQVTRASVRPVSLDRHAHACARSTSVSLHTHTHTRPVRVHMCRLLVCPGRTRKKASNDDEKELEAG